MWCVEQLKSKTFSTASNIAIKINLKTRFFLKFGAISQRKIVQNLTKLHP